MSQLRSPNKTNSDLIKEAMALLKAIRVHAGADGGR